jgi:hypothetical protein
MRVLDSFQQAAPAIVFDSYRKYRTTAIEYNCCNLRCIRYTDKSQETVSFSAERLEEKVNFGTEG